MGVEVERSSDSTLNVLNKQLGNVSAENQYVTFQIGDEEYGIDIMIVQEIIRYKKPTRVFNSNPVVRGVINFRGKVIPVIDMHKKFCLPVGSYDEFTVVIVIEVARKTMGMIVDRVSDIRSFEKQDIQLVDNEFSEDIKTQHLKGIGKAEEGIVLLLDQSKVLTFEDQQELEDRDEG